MLNIAYYQADSREANLIQKYRFLSAYGRRDVASLARLCKNTGTGFMVPSPPGAGRSPRAHTRRYAQCHEMSMPPDTKFGKPPLMSPSAGMTRFQLIPKFYQSEPLPIVQDLAFPPFKIEHRYKGVYERAGFDINRGGSGNNGFNAPNGAYRTSRSRNSSLSLLPRSSHQLAQLVPPHPVFDHSHTRLELELTLPVSDRSDSGVGVGKRNVKGLMISTDLPPMTNRQPSSPLSTLPALLLGRNPSFNFAPPLHTLLLLKPPLIKLPVMAPLLPSVAQSQRPPFAQPQPQLASQPASPQLAPQAAPMNYLGHISHPVEGTAPPLGPVYPHEHYHNLAEPSPPIHDENPANQPVPYPQTHTAPPSQPQPQVPDHQDQFVPVTEKMRQRQSQEQLQRRSTLTKKRSIKKINQIDLALQDLRSEVESHRSLQLSSLPRLLTRFSQASPPPPLPTVDILPKVVDTDSEVPESKEVQPQQSSDYQNFLMARPEPQQYRQSQVLMVSLIILRDNDLFDEDDLDDESAAELQRQLDELKFNGGKNLNINSPSTNQAAQQSSLRNQDHISEFDREESPTPIPATTDKFKHPKGVPHASPRVAPPSFVVEQAPEVASVPPAVPTIEVNEPSSVPSVPQITIESSQEPSIAISSHQPTQAESLPSSREVVSDQQPRRNEKSPSVVDLERSIDASIYELEQQGSERGSGSEPPRPGSRLLLASDDYDDMLLVALYDLVQPLFVGLEDQHAEVKIVKSPPLPQGSQFGLMIPDDELILIKSNLTAPKLILKKQVTYSPQKISTPVMNHTPTMSHSPQMGLQYPRFDFGADLSPLMPIETKHAPGQGPCRACSNEVSPDAKGPERAIFSRLGDLLGQWHRGCFTCSHPDCQVAFSKHVQCYVYADYPYCGFHYHQENGTLCELCSTGIEGECIENELLQKWHLHCLRCLKCRRTIRDDYYLINGDIYCEHDGKNIILGNDLINGEGRGLTQNDKVERRRTRLMFVDGQTIS